MQSLLLNMRYLCDETQMLTGICAAYGTAKNSECVAYGRAQEVQLIDGVLVPRERPLTQESIFDLASLTKLIVCTAAMRMTELGLLSLDEYVGDIDPRFIHLKDVSVFDVLCYRVCLQTPGRIDDAPTREEGLFRLFGVRTAQLPPVRIYSDINAMVIKYIIESKSGLPLYEALRRYVFLPAGMMETFSAVPPHLLDRCVCYNYEHRIVRDRYILRSCVPPGTAHDPKALLLCDKGRDLCGHAGLFSTAQDMTRFAQALLRGDLLRRDTLLEIATNRTGQHNPDGTYRQPLGFLCFLKHPVQRLSEVPAYMSEHGFGISGFTGNHLVIDPDLGVFELFLGNRCHARISHITPPEGQSIEDFGLDERGAGRIPWPDGRLVPTSARYVYQKDACLHEPIVQRMHQLGWL